MESANGHDYKIGDLTRGGHTIKDIRGTSKNVIVYKTDTGNFRYECALELDTKCIPIMNEYYFLLSQIDISLPRKYKKFAVEYLEGLVAMKMCLEGDNTDSFEGFKDFLTKKVTESAQVYYIVGSTIAVILVIATYIRILDFFPYKAIDNFGVIGVIPGCLGAYISVVQRARSFIAELFISRYHLLFEGGIRILLGLLFGMFFVLASKAEFIMGFVSGKEAMLIVMSAVAGFSERFIPELLQELEKKDRSSRPGGRGH